jgi:flagellar basal-body rod protein FlgC
MDLSKTTAISAAGMAVQKARVEAAALNLANMHTSSAAGSPVFAARKVTVESFAQALGGTALPRAVVVPQATTPRSVWEPGHPHADATGHVAYPDVDATAEMMTVVSALRGYEANLAALQATRSLAAKALEIGGGS